MDVTDLAVAVIYLLKPHLSALAHRQPLGQSDEVVQQLWNSLQPLVTTNHRANQVLNQAVENPSEEHFNIFKAQLERLFHHNKTAAHRLAYIIGSGIQQRKLSSLPSELAPFAEPDFLERLSQRYTPAINADNLRCQVCGRQDETLRAVSFPYVVSMVRVTQRRAYSGLWCARHALRYHLLACLLTGTVGWLGIPWGFFYSPLTLFQLVKGGKVNAQYTLRALQAVAQEKLDRQDIEGATRIYETGLRLAPENFYFQQQLLALPTSSTAPRRMGRQFLSFLGVILIACVMGLVVGAIDYLVGYASSIYYPEGVSLFGLILLSIPMVIGIYFAVMILTQVIQKTLIASRTSSAPLAVSLSLIASLLLVHAMLVGNVLTDFSIYWEPAPLLEVVWTIGYTLINGSKVLILYYLTDITPAVTIYFVTLAAALILSLAVTIPDALAITRWRRRLAEIRQQIGQASRRAPVGGWFSIIGVVLGYIGLLVFFSFPYPFYGPYSDPEVMALIEEGFAWSEQGQMDQAVALMSEAVELAPEDAFTHWAYGVVHYQKGECQTALTEFETALSLDLASELIPTSYLGMGRVHDCLYNYEQALASYEQALEHDPTMAQAYLDMGLTYLHIGLPDEALEQFKQAATLEPQNSAAYSFEAVGYYCVNQEESMAAAIDQAEGLLTDEVYDQWAMGIFYVFINEFSQAEEYFQKGLEQDPDHFTLRLQLAYTYTQQGKFEEAHQLADQVAEACWDETILHLSRSDIYFYEEDLESAEVEALEALEINPQSAEAYDQLAIVYYFQGDSEQATASAQRALKLDPYLSSAYNVLALVDYDQGRIDDALQAAQRSIELNPKGDLGYYIFGLCHMDQGQSEEAITAFETFLELTWDRAFIRDYVPQAKEYLQQLKNE